MRPDSRGCHVPKEPSRAANRNGTGPGEVEDCIDLSLYVTNQTPDCLAAFDNLRQICEEQLKGRYRITVIDVGNDPEIARKDGFLAIPTVIRRYPGKGRKKVIGTLNDDRKVMAGLGLSLRPIPT
jgi:circadian clock protein KaiB